jgi:ketosteroid isomerase-like protein
LPIVREYLDAIEAGATGAALATFYNDDAVQVELPNRLNPQSADSDLSKILRRAELGQKLLRAQRFEIRSEIAQRERVAVEVHWTGILAEPLGSLAAGATLKAHFAIFFEFSGGKISRQRNYDCFEPC